MQSFQSTVSAPATAVFEPYSVRQKLLSASLSLTMTTSASITCALAHSSLPTQPLAPGAITPASFAHTSLSHGGFTPVVGGALHPLPTVFSHSILPTTTAKSLIQSAVNQAIGTSDLNLASAAPIFQPGGLAGFHSIILDIGGKQQQVSLSSKLTASELVAAQQVLSGGKQEISINSKGIATGGSFDLNSSTITALDNAVGGTVGSLVIAHGVHAIDTLSSLSLSGSLIDMGSLAVGASPSAKGQTVDTITAANIYNGQGAVISSAAASNTIAPAGISLSTPGAFYNSGTINSSSVLNISAPAITNAPETGAASGLHSQPVISAAQNVNLNTQSLTNSGLISSGSGNVNIVNGGGNSNINVVGTDGTIQAEKGNINFNQDGYSGSGNVTLIGGDYLSKQVNLNAGTGAIEANVGEVTGVVNGTAGSSHVTAATDDLQLGTICVSGDPTYFNTAGSISITGTLTGNPDLAVIASENIIGAGGSLITTNTGPGGDGGAITLVAGANISSVTPTGTGTGGTATSGNGDGLSTVVLTTSASSVSKFGGSATGGYIDLSGINLSSTKTAPITTIDSSSSTGTGGAITMVAYQGSEKNAGSIIATASQTTGAKINATGATGDGAVTLIGGGSLIFAQNIEAGALTIYGSAPTITGANVSVFNGTVTGAFSPSTDVHGNVITTNTEVLVGAGTINNVPNGNINSGGDLTITTGGLVNLTGVVHVAGANGATIISTDGFVEGYYLSTAGAGGISPAGGGNGGSGGAGGAINITGAGIFYEFLDSSGGGGAGGASSLTGSGNGGAGGAAGNVTLTATSNNIGISGYLNASGGGGGGGAGAAAGQTVGGTGGGAGSSGIVTIKTPFSYEAGQPFGYSILDFDGAAGGNGGASTAISTSAGGGGGGGTAFGGGGGGGAAGCPGATGSGTAVGGGGAGVYFLGSGGGGAGTTTATTSATGGGGGSSTGPLGTVATGGAGGTAVGGGAAGVVGAATLTETNPGGNGGGSSSTLGGLGGVIDAPGGGGAGGNGVTGFGSTGGNTTLVNGHGQVFLTVGAATGKATDPVGIDTTYLTLTGTTKAASIFDGSGGQSVTLESATMVAGSTLSILESHQDLLTVAGPITGASVVNLDGWGGVEIDGTITAGTSVNVSAGMNSFTENGQTFSSTPGSITGAGIITAPTVNLSALLEQGIGGNITATVAAPIVNVSAAGGTAAITVDTAATKTTSITVTNIPAAGSLTVNGATDSPVVVKDASANALSFAGTGVAGDTISFTTGAKTLTVGNLTYSGVKIQDTFATAGAGAAVVLANSAGNQIGDGTGAVTITTAAADINPGAAGNGIFGTSVALTSTAGNVGKTGTMEVSTPVLTATAKKGLVDVADSQAAVLNAGSALTSYTVSGAGLTVAGVIGGATINLTGTGAFPVVLNANVGSSASTGVTIMSADGISQNKTAAISGLNVTLTSSSGDIGSLTQNVLTKAGTLLTINDANSGNAYIGQSGKATLGANTVATSASLSLIDSSALTVSGAVNYSDLTLTTPALTIGASGSLSASTLFVTSALVTVNPTTNGITIAVNGSASFLNKGAITIEGPDGSISMGAGSTLTLGQLVSSKTSTVISTTSITLGNAKTGDNDPLSTALSDLTGLSVANASIYTTGNFSSDLADINLTNPFGGTLNITAKNLVFLEPNPTFTAIPISALGSMGAGTINLNLTGTQAVTLSNQPGSATLGVPYELSNTTTIAGISGTVNVSTGGNLTVLTGALANIQSGATLDLTSAKSLAISADLSTGFSTINLSSGSTTPFLIGGGTNVSNGTSGSIGATNVSINSAGTITTTGAGVLNGSLTLTLSNNSGILTVNGSPGDILTPGGLTLIAKSGITLGDLKTDPNATDPFQTMLGSGNLLGLTIRTGGNFTSVSNAFVLSSAGNGGSLQITAGNIVVLNNPTNSPITLSASGFNNTFTAGTVYLNLTGTQAVTVDSVNGTKAPPFIISDVGSAGSGSISVFAGGSLTVNGGLSFANGLSNVTLSGAKGLAVTAGAGLFTSTDNFGTVQLSSGASAPLALGAASVAAGGNAVVGNIFAGSLTVTALSGITINNSASVNATAPSGNLEFDTKSFLDNGNVIGGGSSTLLFGNAGNNVSLPSLVIAIPPGGDTFAGITGLAINATGAVNTGSFFIASTGLSSVNVTAGGSLTFSPINPAVTVGSGGTIDIAAGSLVTKSTTLPITFVASGASSVTIVTKSALTVGALKGDIQVAGQSSSGSTLDLTSTGGTLTIGESLSFGSGTLSGSSLMIGGAVAASTSLSALATSTSGSISAAGFGVFLGASTLTIAEANLKLAKTATAIDADTVNLGTSTLKGALFLNNESIDATTTTALNPIAALSYTTNGTSQTTTIGSITTTAGGITIAAAGAGSGITTQNGSVLSATGGGITLIVGDQSGGTLALGAGSSISTSAGSIILQNQNFNTGVITVGSGVDIHASGTAKGVGQVSIFMGATVPAELALGVVPVTNPPTLITTGGGTVTFSIVGNLTGTITSSGTGNVLNASGRNVVFYENTGGLISLAGDDTIVADPPVAGAASSAVNTAPMISSVANTYILTPTIAPGTVVSQPAGYSSLAGVNATAAISQMGPGAASNATAVGQSNLSALNSVSLSDVAAAETDSQAALAHRPPTVTGSTGLTLGGTVSNIAQRKLVNGPMLIAPDIDTSVCTSFGSVDVAAHAVALIIAFEGGIAVYNLHDQKQNSVVITCVDRRVSVFPGRNAVLTNRDIRYFEEINPAEFVGYRRLSAQARPDGLRVFQSEFDVSSMLRGVEPLRQLIRANDAASQKITKSMLKTMAILTSFGDATPFECMVAPRMTAINQ